MTKRDPVCGMTVESTTAVRGADGSATYYFCSTACRDRFQNNPAQYVSRATGEDLERHEPPHTTTGPITAPKFGAAGSGGAEYEPIPEQHKE
jgi:Cu+-exporting ATPase